MISCTWRGSDVCVAGQPAWTNLISPIPDHVGRPFSTRRSSLNSIHEDFWEEIPKVPYYETLSSTKAFQRQAQAFTVKSNSNSFGAGVALSDTPFFRKFMVGRIPLVLCRLKARELVWSRVRRDLSLSQSHTIWWPRNRQTFLENLGAFWDGETSCLKYTF